MLNTMTEGLSRVSEDILIAGCRKGDRKAMQALYELYAAKMLAVCVRYVQEGSVARDLLHDGFLVVFDKIGDFRAEGSFEGWMRRVFVTTCLGYLRKRANVRVYEPLAQAVQITDTEISALERMSAQELIACMGKLPEGYRTVLNLFAVEGYSHREIAGMLGISEGTSRSQYSRARACFLKVLKESDMI